MDRGFKLSKNKGYELPIQYNNQGVTPIEYVLDIKCDDFKIFRQPLIVTNHIDEM